MSEAKVYWMHSTSFDPRWHEVSPDDHPKCIADGHEGHFVQLTPEIRRRVGAREVRVHTERFGYCVGGDKCQGDHQTVYLPEPQTEKGEK